jgi:hypothetical protein
MTLFIGYSIVVNSKLSTKGFYRNPFKAEFAITLSRDLHLYPEQARPAIILSI